jgi:SAM-dependent methyltransferase
MVDGPLTDRDFARSRTSYSMSRVLVALRPHLNPCANSKLLDIGCGFGGIAAAIRDEFGIAEAYGVDIDPAVIEEANAKGVRARQWDIQEVPLPFEDRHFHLITCFGVLDYLRSYDDVLLEAQRLMTDNGIIAISLPNLAAWHNRLFLALGYQPRDVEVSHTHVVGAHPYYRTIGDDVPTGHIHTATTYAFQQLMKRLGFIEIATHGLQPHRDSTGFSAFGWLDRIASRRPSLARRFLYIGRKNGQQQRGR